MLRAKWLEVKPLRREVAMVHREQISAIDRLWCMDRCRREGKDHYWCNTIFGEDHCSPSPNVGSQGPFNQAQLHFLSLRDNGVLDSTLVLSTSEQGSIPAFSECFFSPSREKNGAGLISAVNHLM